MLLGGRSTRMGADKAGVTLGGVAFATRIARTLARLVEDVILVGGEAPPDAPGRRVADPPGTPSPLRGLVGALEAACAERVLVLATDVPLVSEPLLLALLAQPAADVVVPRTAGLPQPLCALYRREAALAVARAHLASGRLALRALLDALACRFVEEPELARLDPAGLALANANAPDDVARLEQALAAGGGVSRGG